MTKTQIKDHFEQLNYEEDIRKPADSNRWRAFKTGWHDATLRERKYSKATLRNLTWQNLGYRYGQKFGDLSEDETKFAFGELADFPRQSIHRSK